MNKAFAAAAATAKKILHIQSHQISVFLTLDYENATALPRVNTLLFSKDASLDALYSTSRTSDTLILLFF